MFATHCLMPINLIGEREERQKRFFKDGGQIKKRKKENPSTLH
jgi:hypothetical protein